MTATPQLEVAAVASVKLMGWGWSETMRKPLGETFHSDLLPGCDVM